MRSRPAGDDGHEHFRCWWLVSEGSVWAHSIVVAPPAFDDDLGFAQCVEDLAIEQLIAQSRIEALDVTVVPGAAAIDVGGLRSHRCDPFLDSLGHELRAVVRTICCGTPRRMKRSDS